MFSDGQISECRTNRRLLDFRSQTMEVEDFSNVQLAEITMLYDDNRGHFRGIQIFDSEKVCVLSMGDFDDWSNNRLTVQVEPGERILGLKAGKRGEPDAYWFDLQFILGRKAL